MCRSAWPAAARLLPPLAAVWTLTILATALSWLPYVGWLVEILALYCALGMRSHVEYPASDTSTGTMIIPPPTPNSPATTNQKIAANTASLPFSSTDSGSAGHFSLIQFTGLAANQVPDPRACLIQIIGTQRLGTQDSFIKRGFGNSDDGGVLRDGVRMPIGRNFQRVTTERLIDPECIPEVFMPTIIDRGSVIAAKR